MKLPIILRSIRRNNNGATAVEFALVASMFFFLLFAIIEVGMYQMTRVGLEAAVAQASRTAAITQASLTNPVPFPASGNYPGHADCTDKICVMEETIKQRASGLLNYQGMSITSAVANASGAVATPFAGDLCLDTPQHIGGSCSPPLGFVDLNGDGVYNAAATSSLGNPGDIIQIHISYPWNVLNPMFAPFFHSDSGTVSTTTGAQNADGVVVIDIVTMVRNE